MLVVVIVWLAFVLPFVVGRVRFPVDFAGSRDGRPVQLANPEQGDAYYAFYPWHRYLGERLADGEVPLWDPHRFAGTPFAADIAVGLWYPPNWFYAFGHTVHVFTLISVASSLVAVLLMHWLLRLLRLHPYAAAFGAVGFAFSAFVVKWATNEHVLGSVIWLALPLGGLEVARQGRRFRGTLLTAAGLSLVVVAGHAQLALYVWMTTFIWAAISLAALAVRALRSRAPLRPAARALVYEAVPVAAAVVLALGLTAVQLLPTQELVSGIVRQRTTWDVARSTFLPRQHAATLLVPDYLGSPIDGNWQGPGVNYTETMLYAGLLALPLALYGSLHRNRRAAAFFVVVTSIGVLAVLGTPFYRLVLATPGLSRGLFATRFILLVDFGLAGLAALGVDRLARREDGFRQGLVVLGGSFAVLLIAVGWLALALPGTSQPGSYVGPLALHAASVLLLGAGAVAAMVRFPAWTARMVLVLVVVSAGDLWLTGYRFNPFHKARPVYQVQPPIDSLQAVPGVRPRFADIGTYIVAPNGSLVHGLYGIEGYDPLVPRPIVELVGVAEDQLGRARSNFVGPFEPETAAAPVFDLLGINNMVGQIERVDAQGSIGRPMLGRPGAFPPAFATSCWDFVAAPEVLDRIAGMDAAALRRTVVVGDDPGSRSALREPAAGPCIETDVSVTRYEPERVSMEVEVAARSVVVLTDSWYPGWEATVDGKPTPLVLVDHALRGVAVDPGPHRVEMRFRPARLRAGAVVSLATLFSLAVAGVVQVLRRRERVSRRRGSR